MINDDEGDPLLTPAFEKVCDRIADVPDAPFHLAESVVFQRFLFLEGTSIFHELFLLLLGQLGNNFIDVHCRLHVDNIIEDEQGILPLLVIDGALNREEVYLLQYAFLHRFFRFGIDNCTLQ